MAQTVSVIVSAEERVRLAAIVFLLRTGLMLRVQRPTAKKGADIEVGYPTARGRVRFMPDEHATRLGFAA